MPAPRIVGRYALYGEIAAGGMATVHLGRLIGGGGVHRLVAIKRLHAQFAKDPEFVTMFLDEGRLTARIHHPNVVSVLDFLVLESELFLVMEYVQGEALSSLIKIARKREQAIPTKVAASIAIGLLQGLHAAHIATSEKGEPLHIVHRDVSPQNVLVSVDGVARVLDFGVAKAAGRLQTTREGHIKGKIAYMAPEQLRSEKVDHRADIYGAAVVLWELLVGRRLFDGENEGALLTQIVLGKIEPPSKFAPDLPAGWDEVVMKGLAPNPDDRYASAEDMAEAIEAIGPVATSRAVGQWISSLASESIARRAEAVRQIEQNDDASAAPSEVALASLLTPGARARAGISSPNASAPDLATPASDSARSASARDPELSAGATSLPSHIAGVGSSRDRSRSKLSTPIVLAVAGLVVLGGLALFAKTRGTSDGSATSAALHDAPTGTVDPASAVSTATSGPTVLPGAPVAPASASASAVAASAVPSSRPASAPAVGLPPHPPNVASPPAAPPKPPAKVDCSSPFYVDANGDRHVKRECL